MLAETPGRLLDHQKEYYRQRAGGYDQWFYRQGRYVRGPVVGARWWPEVALVEDARSLVSLGKLAEPAVRTGIWTEKLTAQADSGLAVDSSPEVLDLNRARNGSSAEYLTAGIFDWPPERGFDTGFFAFWLSHVPADRFAAFWTAVSATLRPGGRVFLVDSLPADEAGAKDHLKLNVEAGLARRKLNDDRGSTSSSSSMTPSSWQSVGMASAGARASTRRPPSSCTAWLTISTFQPAGRYADVHEAGPSSCHGCPDPRSRPTPWKHNILCSSTGQKHIHGILSIERRIESGVVSRRFPAGCGFRPAPSTQASRVTPRLG